MSKFGSFYNKMMADSAPAVPEVGMGATVILWSDRSPATVCRVRKSGKSAWIQYDEYKRTDDNGMSDAQSYTFTPQPEGHEYEIRRRRDGSWYIYGGGATVALGFRSRYHDFSF